MHEEEGGTPAVTQRVRRAQQEIIGNEALGGGSLDEAGARELLTLGLKSAEGIASATDGLDDAAAELSMTDRLKALRKLIRYLGRLLGEGLEMDEEGRAWLWNNIQEYARSLYGDHLEFPTVDVIMGRLTNGENPGRIIVSLREMFENQK